MHCAIDGHTRLAYAEIHPDETATTCAASLRRAAQVLATQGIPVIERVMTDNAMAYRRSHVFREAIADIGASHRLTRSYRPQTTAKPNASTAPSPRNGPTPRPSPAASNAPTPCPNSCTTTTTTEPTPHSEDSHPSAASTTSQGTTPSRLRPARTTLAIRRGTRVFTVVLDPVVAGALVTWLRTRVSRWPRTSNPHLFITDCTALNEAPISRYGITVPFRKLGITAQQLRVDRILDEAGHAGDPVQLMRVFELGVGAAVRYVRAAHPEKFRRDLTSP